MVSQQKEIIWWYFFCFFNLSHFKEYIFFLILKNSNGLFVCKGIEHIRIYGQMSSDKELLKRRGMKVVIR